MWTGITDGERPFQGLRRVVLWVLAPARDLSRSDPPPGIEPVIGWRTEPRGWSVAHLWGRMGGSSLLDDMLYEPGSNIDTDNDPLKSAEAESQRGDLSPPSLQGWPTRTMI
jgi:hypothetical protein